MEIQRIYKEYQSVMEVNKKLHKQVEEGSLYLALSELEKEVAALMQVPQIQERVSATYQSYKDLMGNGAAIYTPEQLQTCYYGLSEAIHSMIDSFLDAKMMVLKEHLEIPRYYKGPLNADVCIAKIKEAGREGGEARYASVETLFDALWIGWVAGDDIFKVAKFIFNEKELQEYEQMLLVGGIFMGAVFRLELNAISTLVYVITNPNLSDKFRGRGLAMFMVLLPMYYNRIMAPEQCRKWVDSVLEAEGIREVLFEVYLAIQKIKVIPLEREMEAQMGMHMMDNIDSIEKINAESIFSNEEEVSLIIEGLFSSQPQFKRMMNKVDKWRVGGVDVLFGMYNSMKDNDFFKNHLTSWIIPYDSSNPIFRKEMATESYEKYERLVERYIRTPYMAESDRYSMMLQMKRTFTEDQIDKILNTVADEQLVDYAESIRGEKTDKSENIHDRLVYHATNCVYDLYRLSYNGVWNRATELSQEEITEPHVQFVYDIFAPVLSFHNSAGWGKVFPGREYKERLCVALKNYDLYADAAQVYNELLAEDEKRGKLDANTLRKAALCNLKSKNYAQAYVQLDKADIIEEGDLWTKRKMAECLFKQGDMRKAMSHMKEAEKLAPNDISIKLEIVQILMSMEMYGEALDVMSGIQVANSVKFKTEIVRQKARCNLYIGNVEGYFEDIKIVPDNELTLADKMNTGLAYLCLKEKEEAIPHLKAFISSIAAEEKNMFYTDSQYRRQMIGWMTKKYCISELSIIMAFDEVLMLCEGSC